MFIKFIHFYVKPVTFLTSSKTRLINLNDSKSVSTISDTETPMYFRGSINHRNANANCSGDVAVRQGLAL